MEPTGSTVHIGKTTTVNVLRVIILTHSELLRAVKKLILGNGYFTILFDGAYFLFAGMVEGDDSSRLRIAN